MYVCVATGLAVLVYVCVVMVTGIAVLMYVCVVMATGIALLHFHLSNIFDHDENPRYLKSALSYVEHPLRHLKRKKATFLCGDAGPLALGAVLYHRIGHQDKCEDCLHRYDSVHFFYKSLLNVSVPATW